MDLSHLGACISQAKKCAPMLVSSGGCCIGRKRKYSEEVSLLAMTPCHSWKNAVLHPVGAKAQCLPNREVSQVICLAAVSQASGLALISSPVHNSSSPMFRNLWVEHACCGARTYDRTYDCGGSLFSVLCLRLVPPHPVMIASSSSGSGGFGC